MRVALGNKFVPPFRGGGTVDPLLVGLESYWTLDELSGTRFDSIGSNDLTDNNTVGFQNDGPRGVNASFVTANNEYLGVAVSDPFAVGGGSVSFWNYNTGIADETIFQTCEQFAHDWDHFRISCASANNAMSMRIRDAAWGTIKTITEPDGPPFNTWNHYVCIWDKSTTSLTIYRNGVVSVTDTYVGVPVATDNKIMVGDPNPGIDGRVGRVGLWDGILNAPYVLELYNAGRGKSYSDLSPGIKTDLVSYWNLDEPSRGALPVTRNDSYGTNHLTDNNTVTSVNTGPEAVIAKFDSATSDALTRAAAATTPEWTVTSWVSIPASTTDGAILVRIDTWPFKVNVGLYIVNGVVFGFVGNGAAAFAQTGGITLPIDTPVFVVATYDATNGVSVYVNLGPPDSALLGAGTIYNGTATYAMGDSVASGVSDCKLSRVGYWDRVLTGPELISIFNSGSGKAYDSLTAGEKSGLLAYWNLTELSGNRADSHGVNTLTDVNTVMSVINMNDVADKVCAKFVNANNEYLSGSILTFPANSDFTMTMWVNVTDPSISRYIIGDTADSGNLVFGYGGASFWVMFINAFGVNVQGDVSDLPVANVWVFVALWYDHGAGTFGFSINNGTVHSAASVSNGAVSNIQIGARGAGGAAAFDGKVDEVTAYSRKLLALEITRLFNLGKGRFYPTFT